MENGSDACPQAKGIEENLLHKVICRGLTKCLPDKGDVRTLVRTMLAYATSEDELLIEKQSLESSIKELRQKADEAETMRERTEGNTQLKKQGNEGLMIGASCCSLCNPCELVPMLKKMNRAERIL